MEDKIVEFSGKVIRQIWANEENSFRIYAFDVDPKTIEEKDLKKTIYGSVSVKGTVHELGQDLDYNIKAKETYDDKNGYSYQLININRSRPQNSEEMYYFLKEVITPTQAEILWNAYPTIVQKIIDDDLDDVDLSKTCGIKEARFEVIRRKVIDNYALAEMVVEFKGLLSMAMIKKLYDKYSSVKLLRKELKTDPYVALCRLNGVGFKTADSIILELEEEKIIDFGYDLKTSKQRCLGAMLYLLGENENSGNTKMDLRELRQQVIKLTPLCSDKFVEALKNEHIYYNKDKLVVALKNTYETEKYIAANIKEGLSIIRRWDYDWKSYQNKGEFNLSDEQIGLLRSVCENNITILSGGAGMGKSASTGMLMEMLKDNNKTFVLATPTGKSAKVLTDFANVEAKTIHRALGYNPQTGWEYNQEHKLECDVLLLDEFSMVSVDLMEHVIDAIDFNITKLVLIGDPNQLPSISAGNLLHDFLMSKVIPVVRLTKVFRYGDGGILTVATDINNNKKFVSDDSDKITFFGKNKDYAFIKSEDKTIIKESVALYKKIITEGINGKVYEPKDVVILTAYNKGDYGAIELNKQLQKIANKNYGSSKNFKYGDSIYYLNDIIMQQSNNYKARVYIGDDFFDEPKTFIANGECAVVKSFNNEFMVNDFDGSVVKYYREDLNNVSLAYSYTTHKSQGSTIKAVILISPRSHIYMLNANLMYVGVTRASEYVYHFGLPSTINMAMKKKENYNRNTFMQEFLTC